MHEDDYCFNKIISLLALLLGETGVMSDIRACMWPSLTAWPLHASVPKEQANCRNPTRSILNKEIYLDVRVKAGFFSWPNVSVSNAFSCDRKPDLQQLTQPGLLF